MYKKIGDYGIIGNRVTTALVGNDGAIDWLCLPHMDSPSVFTALLDDETGGRFAIGPAEAWDSVQQYIPQTNILSLRFRTESGEAELLDFMPVSALETESGARRSRLLRCLRGIRGTVAVDIECSPRLDYGRDVPAWGADESVGNLWYLHGYSGCLTLFSNRDIAWRDERARYHLQAEDTVWFLLGWDEDPGPFDEKDFAAALAATSAYWKAWITGGRLGKYPTTGFWQEQLDRSALVMKLLQCQDSGAIAAAPTTSLPAIIHGSRNWDYRYSWLRDSSMTLAALQELGHIDEVAGYVKWLREVCMLNKPERLGVVYRLYHAEAPGDELILGHLSGYKNSSPVRVGQFVIHQHQHDVYGEILDSLFLASSFVGKIDVESWDMLKAVVDHVCTIWQAPDHGIWEARTEPRHYTHSKLMCWVALDRGIKIAEHYGFPAPLTEWEVQREAVRRDILSKGWNQARGSFVQHYGSEAVDAALLLIPLTHFLPVKDPRVSATIRLIEQELLQGDLIQRYQADDGLPGQEQGFLICLFWYLNCLILQGRLDETEEHLRRVSDYSNHLGLFGEQYDPNYREITGNFPQGFSHIGYVSTVLNYLKARSRPVMPLPMGFGKRLQLARRTLLLNEDELAQGPYSGRPAEQIKQSMNTLRGLFYDGHSQSVDYERLRGSEYYQIFRATAARLKAFEPDILGTDAERIAFWINVYNAIVVHGVIELGILRSVKEVPFFFARIQYDIGGKSYSPDDIEHGILRGNVRPYMGLRQQFRSSDPRCRHVVRKPDCRIHFALVCASRTCPPVEAYDPERLEHQLETSAEVFINGTSRLDRKARILEISEIFKWYRRDFNRNNTQLVRYVADYLYDYESAEWLRQNAGRVKIRYKPYDWRLNR